MDAPERRAKEVPLSTHKFQIGLLTVVVLVGLRLALGCHFLYEGVWKVKHTDIFHNGASEITPEEFNAEPFLTQAKGPVAFVFYAMLDDLNGRERLRVEKGADGKETINTDALAARWDGIRRDFVAYYRPAAADDKEADEFNEGADRVCKEFQTWAKEYLQDNLPEIKSHFMLLDRFEGRTKTPHSEIGQDAPFQKERNWKEMMELRGEANTWLKDIEAQEKALKNSLYALLSDSQKAKGQVPRSWNVFAWDRITQINFAVTFALTAIGACLMLGLCSRLAALGGAGFMCFVVLTQPAFPTIFPPDPAVVGHALLINKDFIEMMALLVIASVPAGRWAGLDFFLYRTFRWLFFRNTQAAAKKS